MRNVINKVSVFFCLIYLCACSVKKNVSSSTQQNSSQTSTEVNTSKSLTVKDKYIMGYYAQELGVSVNELKNVQLFRFIDEWIGVPYRIGGMTKTGIDCSGFTNLLYKTVYQINIPRTTSQIYSSIDSKPYSDLKEGDIVFMNYDGKNNSHVGVYLKNGRFIHASTSKGVIINDFNQPWYQKVFSTGGEVIKSVHN